MLKFFKLKLFLLCFVYSFACANSIVFSSLNIADIDFEVDFACDKLVISTSNFIYLIDTLEAHKEKKEVYQFKEVQQFVPKIALCDDLIVFTTQKPEIKAINFNGKEIFATILPAFSRSNIVCSDGNIFISLTNAYIICFASNGEIVWINKDFFTENLIAKNSKNIITIYKDEVLFLHKLELSILNKKTGMKLVGIDNFSKVNDIYFDHHFNKVYSTPNDYFVSYNLKKNSIIEEQNGFNKKFFTQDVAYCYENGVLKNLDTKQEFKFNITNFEFFEDKIFAYEFGSKKLVLIKGNNVQTYDLDIRINKFFYKDNILVISDNSNIYWAKIEL